MAKISTSNPLARFPRAVHELKQRVIGISAGEPGSRKTSFWLEAPGPVVVFSFDQGMEGVVNRIVEENPSKEIYISEYDWVPDAEGNFTQEQAQEIRDRFTDDYEHALHNARTVLIDKETDLWSIFRYAEFGAPMADQQKDFDKVNARMRRVVNAAKPLDINLGFVDSLKDEWGAVVNKKTGAVGRGPTGERIRSGFNELDGLVHVELYHTGHGAKTWTMTVGKVRGAGNPEVADQTFREPVLTFPEFALLMFPGSKESDWE